MFASESGLLVISPVVLAAGYGLWLLARRFLAEGLVCAAVAFAFLFLNCGYIFPLGGLSPGPRYLVPGLPFLALGLAPGVRAAVLGDGGARRRSRSSRWRR